MNYIRSNGGKLLLNEEVNKLRVENNRVTKVQTKSGKEFSGKVVVSNINPITVFSQMIPSNYSAYLDKLFSIRLGASVFQVFLGTDRDIISESGINDFQIFHIPGYDIKKNSENALAGKFEKAGFLISLFDNIYRGYSPEGKNTISILLVQDFATWENLPPQEIEIKKQTYKNQLVKIAEQCGLKDLSKHIEVEEIFTPLDCVKLANSYRGAIYGWQGNRGNSRLPQTTPIENLFLAGAWTQPGPGETGVMISGLECFKKAAGILSLK
jgi:prolycopene isomerase